MAFEDQRTTVYKVDPTHPESETLPTLRTEELLLNMGPQHPSTHGVLKVILELEGERLVKSTPVMGFLHRGVEKLAEEGTYHQFIPHTDRLDYVCAMYNNFAYCRAVEKLMNIAPNISGRSSPRSSGSSAISSGWAPRRWISAR
jgi:NADH-quinone oxidoreductase subunit D